jgi:flagellar biosynthesis GTPase FlhF
MDEQEVNSARRLKALREQLRRERLYSHPDVQKLLDLADELLVYREVKDHPSTRIKQELIRDRKNQPLSRPLLVLGLPDIGRDVFLSPSKPDKGREHLRAEKARKELEEQEKQDRAVQKQPATEARREAEDKRKEERAKQAIERAEKKILERQEIEARKAARKQAAEARKQATEARKQNWIQKGKSTTIKRQPKLAKPTLQIRLQEVENKTVVEPSTSRSGRQVRLPGRFA